MAYVSKEKKVIIVNAVKSALPKDWKVTFAVRHYSTIVCTVRSAPLDLAEEFGLNNDSNGSTHYNVNPYHVDSCTKNQNLKLCLQRIVDALNTDNYNNSDVMTDYFDVGHYVELRFGEWDKPFKDSRTIAKLPKAELIK